MWLLVLLVMGALIWEGGQYRLFVLLLLWGGLLYGMGS